MCFMFFYDIKSGGWQMLSMQKQISPCPITSILATSTNILSAVSAKVANYDYITRLNLFIFNFYDFHSNLHITLKLCSLVIQLLPIYFFYSLQFWMINQFFTSRHSLFFLIWCSSWLFLYHVGWNMNHLNLNLMVMLI